MTEASKVESTEAPTKMWPERAAEIALTEDMSGSKNGRHGDEAESRSSNAGIGVWANGDWLAV